MALPNTFGGRCHSCGAWVEARTGSATKSADRRPWIIRCQPCTSRADPPRLPLLNGMTISFSDLLPAGHSTWMAAGKVVARFTPTGGTGDPASASSVLMSAVDYPGGLEQFMDCVSLAAGGGRAA